MKYTSQLGLSFNTPEGVQVRSFQLLLDGKAIATADFDDGVCNRFMFADSHEEVARRWRMAFKWTDCGLCYGRGYTVDYGEKVPCGACEAKGGFISDSFSDFEPAQPVTAQT